MESRRYDHPLQSLANSRKLPGHTPRLKSVCQFVQLSNWVQNWETGKNKHVPSVFSAIGEPVRLEWFNPQGERIVTSRRMSLHTESSRSRLIIYNAIVEDAGIYRCQATDASGHTEEASVVLEIYRKSAPPQPKDHGGTGRVLGSNWIIA